MAFEDQEFLAYFGCKCRGVKFYDLKSVGARWWTRVTLVREQSNPYDRLCVAAWVPGERSPRQLQLGHIAKEAAKWLHPLLQPPYRVKRFVTVYFIRNIHE